MQPFYKQPGNLFSTITCANCSGIGHTSKHCTKPITSYGIILFRCKESWNQATILQSDKSSITGFETPNINIEYLLIQRKDSLGFVELVRGKYKLGDYAYIRHTISGMTKLERDKILNLPYDDLWENLWGPVKDGFQAYRIEKEQGRQKLEALRNGTPSLQTLMQDLPEPFTTPEWGFPKGRKNMYESEYACAVRETWEETNIKENQIVPVQNIEPITEVFTGSNGIKYCHKYFIAHTLHGIGEESVASASQTNEHIQHEVGDIRWCSLEEALSLIRADDSQKRDVLLRIDALLNMFCPLQLGPVSLKD